MTERWWYGGARRWTCRRVFGLVLRELPGYRWFPARGFNLCDGRVGGGNYELNDYPERTISHSVELNGSGVLDQDIVLFQYTFYVGGTQQRG